jgi:hypothetical protein
MGFHLIFFSLDLKPKGIPFHKNIFKPKLDSCHKNIELAMDNINSNHKQSFTKYENFT